MSVSPTRKIRKDMIGAFMIQLDGGFSSIFRGVFITRGYSDVSLGYLGLARWGQFLVDFPWKGQKSTENDQWMDFVILGFSLQISAWLKSTKSRWASLEFFPKGWDPQAEFRGPIYPQRFPDFPSGINWGISGDLRGSMEIC
jgi:hypothetical protein